MIFVFYGFFDGDYGFNAGKRPIGKNKCSTILFMKLLNSEDLQQVSALTLSHYENNAERFWLGTRDHDVSQNIQALMAALPKNQKLKILDFGCGPGRDLMQFKKLGHEVIGLEGSPAFCEMARSYSGCEVWQQDFLKLNLPAECFDGIFANASLFHVPSQELPRVLREFHAALKKNGVLFTSNPRGSEEGWEGNRYGNFMEFGEYRKILEKTGFEVVRHYYRPEGKPLDQQPWLAVVAKVP